MGFFGERAKPVEEPVEVEQSGPQGMPELPARRNDTVIAQDITIQGDVVGEGVVQVEGTIQGDMRLTGAVTVAPTGKIQGTVTADVVRVAGRIEGDVTAAEHLRLEKTGRIDGNVATASFVIEDGGRLNGSSTMTRGND